MPNSGQLQQKKWATKKRWGTWKRGQSTEVCQAGEERMTGKGRDSGGGVQAAGTVVPVVLLAAAGLLAANSYCRPLFRRSARANSVPVSHGAAVVAVGVGVRVSAEMAAGLNPSSAPPFTLGAPSRYQESLKPVQAPLLGQAVRAAGPRSGKVEKVVDDPKP